MKTINFIYAGIIGNLLMLVVIFLVIIIRSKKYESKNKEDRRLLNMRSIPEEDMGFLCEERPFVDRNQILN